MKLVIEIPNYDLSQVKNGSIACEIILKAIKEGKPLPKGHGRLIDADELKAVFPARTNSSNVKIGIVRAAINRMSTVIEADTERVEE